VNLSSRLSKNLILINVTAIDHTDALKNMTCLLGKVCEDEEFIKALKDHKSIDGALAGTGSAIFHTFSEAVEDIKIVLALSPSGIPHPARKKEKISMLWLIVSPIKESGTHFQLLSHLESLLLNKIFHKEVLAAKTKDDVIWHSEKRRGVG
jgi:mannitol/fructose-specific phosphotransferase system IIA component (Ntr-type)